MRKLVRFSLEDFFDEYEHRPGLINLASSDAHPWAVRELECKDSWLAASPLSSLHYPDAKAQLIPALRKVCRPADGFDVLPTSGAAEAIALLLHDHAACEIHRHRKSIAVPRPGYGAFEGLARLLGIPVKAYSYVPAQNWSPDVDTLIELARNSDALVLTNPHNPTGHVVATDIVARLSQIMSDSGGLLIVDEVFRMHDEVERAGYSQPGLALIGSLSKVYGLPGLRLGWITASVERIRRLRTIQQLLTLAPSSMTVWAGAAVLADLKAFCRSELIRRNRQILVDWAGAHARHVAISTPAGGTTVCMMMLAGGDENRWFERFLQRQVLLAPGQRCFGIAAAKPWFRLGYGTETPALQEGLARLAEVLQ